MPPSILHSIKGFLRKKKEQRRRKLSPIVSIVSDISFYLEASHKGDGKCRIASTSPYSYIPSLLVKSLPLYQQFFYACTPLPYPSILQLAKPPQSISFHPFQRTTLHSICMSSHAISFMHILIALILPSCHPTCSTQVTHLHSMNS